jgi:hypothetical protein
MMFDEPMMFDDPGVMRGCAAVEVYVDLTSPPPLLTEFTAALTLTGQAAEVYVDTAALAATHSAAAAGLTAGAGLAGARSLSAGRRLLGRGPAATATARRLLGRGPAATATARSLGQGT